MTTVVLGAAGFLGLNLVDTLLANDIVPTCVRRRTTNVLELRRRNVPMVKADLEQPAELALALEGATSVFHLAGHYPRHSLEGAKSLELAVRQQQNVLEAAAAAKVRRLVYVSSTATVAPAAGRPSTERDVFTSAPDYGPYHALKWHMEQLALRERRFEVHVACPSACLGPYDQKVGTSALLLALAAGLDPPHPDGFVSWVDARDVARGLLRLMFEHAPPKRVILSAGTTRLHALMQRVALRYGVAPPSPPLAAAQAIAFADAEERRTLKKPADRPRLSREIADLVVHGPAIDASLARASLNLEFRSLHDTLDAFDVWARKANLLHPTHQEPEWKRRKTSSSTL